MKISFFLSLLLYAVLTIKKLDCILMLNMVDLISYNEDLYIVLFFQGKCLASTCEASFKLLCGCVNSYFYYLLII